VTAVLIRREQTTDVDAIHAVHADAFETELEARLVRALRADPGWLPELSLVADRDGDIVGHVVCTRAHIGGAPALGLGPLGVRTPYQRKGVGSALMHAVLGAADALHESVVVLLGHRGYYPRFGFVPAASVGIEPPGDWDDHFQARPLTAYANTLRGAFAYAKPFTDLTPAEGDASPA
jgi:putative acetyltransferase